MKILDLWSYDSIKWLKVKGWKAQLFEFILVYQSGKNRTTKIPQSVVKGSAAKLARGFVMHWETKGAKNIFHLNENVNYIKIMHEGGSDIMTPDSVKE